MKTTKYDVLKKTYHKTDNLKQYLYDEKSDAYNMLANAWSLDTETTTQSNFEVEKCVRIYMWKLEKITTHESFTGTDVYSLIDCLSRNCNIIGSVFVHNLSFDLSFIENQLLREDFKYTDNGFNLKRGEYSVLRSEMGSVYTANISFKFQDVITFYDSAKLFPMPLSKIGESMGLNKIEDFGYTEYRDIDYKPSSEEWEYLDRDVRIVSDAVEKLINLYKMFRMTRSSIAYELIRINWAIAKYGDVESVPNHWIDKFEEEFPETDVIDWLKYHKAYAGGLTLSNPLHRGIIVTNTTDSFKRDNDDITDMSEGQFNFYSKWLEEGKLDYIDKENKVIKLNDKAKLKSFDVNSEYPGAMLRDSYPKGKPIKFEGEYVYDENYPLYIQIFKAKFKIKKGSKSVPCLPKKWNHLNEMIYSDDDLINKEVMLCNIDLKHFFINYDVSEIEYLGGVMFESTEKSPFKSFVDKCGERKITADKNGDEFGRQMAKLDMNGGYGKFAENVIQNQKTSYLSMTGEIKFSLKQNTPKAKKDLFIAIFITAYARDIFLTGMYASGFDNCITSDTDSQYIIDWDDKADTRLDVDQYRLGAWKLEHKFSTIKCLRPKCYMYLCDSSKENGKDADKIILKCAGISDESKSTIKGFTDFYLGKTLYGTMIKKQVAGGILLKSSEKTLKLLEYDFEKEIKNNLNKSVDNNK